MTISFSLSGQQFELFSDEVRTRVAGHRPDAIDQYWVEIDDIRWEEIHISVRRWQGSAQKSYERLVSVVSADGRRLHKVRNEFLSAAPTNEELSG